jgi:dTDP-4-dehydrorhamnose 3,5-epimerase
MQPVWTELAADGGRLFFIPAGCAHGFLTLDDHSEVFYYMGAPFVPGSGRGVRWNDPAFKIPWPRAPRVISERDASYSDYLGMESRNY